MRMAVACLLLVILSGSACYPGRLPQCKRFASFTSRQEKEDYFVSLPPKERIDTYFCTTAYRPFYVLAYSWRVLLAEGGEEIVYHLFDHLKNNPGQEELMFGVLDTMRSYGYYDFNLLDLSVVVELEELSEQLKETDYERHRALNRGLIGLKMAIGLDVNRPVKDAIPAIEERGKDN